MISTIGYDKKFSAIENVSKLDVTNKVVCEVVRLVEFSALSFDVSIDLSEYAPDSGDMYSIGILIYKSDAALAQDIKFEVSVGEYAVQDSDNLLSGAYASDNVVPSISISSFPAGYSLVKVVFRRIS